jgi:hypothetical protein
MKELGVRLGELESRVRHVCPGALFVPPRVLKRVIRYDSQWARLGWSVPHQHSYYVRLDVLQEIVAADELGMESFRELPDDIILLPRPPDRWLASRRVRDVWHDFSRRLCHEQVHAILRDRLADAEYARAWAGQKIDRLGQPAFAEIHAVLGREHSLLHPNNLASTYVEFVATFFELRLYEPAQLPVYFPSLMDLERVESLASDGIDVDELLRSSRLDGSMATGSTHETSDTRSATAVMSRPTPSASPRSIGRLVRRADRAAARGNLVRAAILLWRAHLAAHGETATTMRELARATVGRLATRLQSALDLEDEQTDHWRAAAPSLLDEAARGFWTASARLLYDLQRACEDHEKDVYALHVLDWLISRGRRPLRRSQPLRQRALLVRHLRRAAKRLRASALAPLERSRLEALFAAALAIAANRLRDECRPMIREAFATAGIEPRNLPERVAQAKMVEELLDILAYRGFTSLSHVRDALALSQLKLADLTRISDLALGDPLLQADTELAARLDGLHRRGELYLGLLQRLSSLMFGNPAGRWFTLYLAIPFGGSMVILEGLQHLVVEPLHKYAGLFEGIKLANLTGIVTLGIVIFALVHVPWFRRSIFGVIRAIGTVLRRVSTLVSRRLLRIPWIRTLVENRSVRRTVRFLAKPLVVMAIGWTVLRIMEIPLELTAAQAGMVYLLVAAVVNSRPARDVEELVTDELLRSWRDFWRSLVELGKLVLEAFARGLDAVERFLYGIDELLRFRQGDRSTMLVAKWVFGRLWSAVEYVIRFLVNLIVEPQLNPIKHFPVVTVAHKLLIPFIPTFAAVLTVTMEKGLAYTVATAIITAIPGVFGFLVWELKANWRLYDANRPRTLRPVIIGGHGEPMRRLLRWGIHSGTLPRAFAKLRLSAERRDQHAVRKNLAAIRRVQNEFRHFVERELAALLERAPGWDGSAICVGEVVAGPNHIRWELTCPSKSAAPLWLAVQDRSGWLYARVRDAGFLVALSPTPRDTFHAALAGVYKMLGIDFIHEQLCRLFDPEKLAIGVTEDGLVAWPRPAFDAEIVYDFSTASNSLHAEVVAGAVAAPVASVEADRVLYDSISITWSEWVEAWESPRPTLPGAERFQILPAVTAPVGSGPVGV